MIRHSNPCRQTQWPIAKSLITTTSMDIRTGARFPTITIVGEAPIAEMDPERIFRIMQEK